MNIFKHGDIVTCTLDGGPEKMMVEETGTNVKGELFVNVFWFNQYGQKDKDSFHPYTLKLVKN
jgi:uncharacterized protein YodC (DUF2158 family)